MKRNLWHEATYFDFVFTTLHLAVKLISHIHLGNKYFRNKVFCQIIFLSEVPSLLDSSRTDKLSV